MITMCWKSLALVSLVVLGAQTFGQGVSHRNPGSPILVGGEARTPGELNVGLAIQRVGGAKGSEIVLIVETDLNPNRAPFLLKANRYSEMEGLVRKTPTAAGDDRIVVELEIISGADLTAESVMSLPEGSGRTRQLISLTAALRGFEDSQRLHDPDDIQYKASGIRYVELFFQAPTAMDTRLASVSVDFESLVAPSHSFLQLAGVPVLPEPSSAVSCEAALTRQIALQEALASTRRGVPGSRAALLRMDWSEFAPWFEE